MSFPSSVDGDFSFSCALPALEGNTGETRKNASKTLQKIEYNIAVREGQVSTRAGSTFASHDSQALELDEFIFNSMFTVLQVFQLLWLAVGNKAKSAPSSER